MRKIILNPEAPREEQIALVKEGDKFRVKLIDPDFWEGADELDLSDEMRATLDIAERVARKLNDGDSRDIAVLVEEAKKEKEIEEVIEEIRETDEGWTYWTTLKDERNKKVRDAVLGASLTKTIKSYGKEYPEGMKITEDNIDVLLKFILVNPSFVDEGTASEIEKIIQEAEEKFKEWALRQHQRA
ncbi:hypothetical protein [Persephonella sp.]